VLASELLAARPEGELLTIYRGAGVDGATAAAAVEHVQARLDGRVEIELVIGDQPHYPFLASLE
jgi:hypothetical protein